MIGKRMKRTVNISVAPMMECTDKYFRYLCRLLSEEVELWTEMVVSETIIHREFNDLDRFLGFDSKIESPLVLQIGGSNPLNCRKAVEIATKSYNYDEINLNCGCPSNRVSNKGCFGAKLMLDPKLVSTITSECAQVTNKPITVKCRLGVDDHDSYEELKVFVETVSKSSIVTNTL